MFNIDVATLGHTTFARKQHNLDQDHTKQHELSLTKAQRCSLLKFHLPAQFEVLYIFSPVTSSQVAIVNVVPPSTCPYYPLQIVALYGNPLPKSHT